MSVKPRLVIGLGNPLMGDEGIGCHLIERLAADARLPPDTELLWGGTDLLACAGRLQGREHVFLLDAMLEAAEPGTVMVFDDLAGLDDRQGGAHQLSPAQAVALLRLANPELRSVRFTVLAVAVESAAARAGLSPALASRLPEITGRVLQALGPSSG